jgi:predicted small lipoprotein YifL
VSRTYCAFARLALIGALAATFALAGCGRKGSLDPPPARAVAGETADGTPAAPARRQPDRRILLDYLLN